MFKSKNNLPIGCQFISKRADDNNLLSISKKILLEFS
jgi:Asp-tRNA(Asn)/Glu-tRNA(Gln) amidotransferase A subunit family amidase